MLFCHLKENSPKCYFAQVRKSEIALTQTRILTLIPTLTQTEEKRYFASRGKKATSNFITYQQTGNET